MRDSTKSLVDQFKDPEYRETYAEEYLNAYVAAQIRTIREQRDLTQEQLADLVNTKQTGISRVENINYSSWNVATLKKIAFALGCRLHVSLETFGSLLDEGASLSREALKRPKFEDDPAFARHKTKSAPTVRQTNRDDSATRLSRGRVRARG